MREAEEAQQAAIAAQSEAAQNAMATGSEDAPEAGSREAALEHKAEFLGLTEAQEDALVEMVASMMPD